MYKHYIIPLLATRLPVDSLRPLAVLLGRGGVDGVGRSRQSGDSARRARGFQRLVAGCRLALVTRERVGAQPCTLDLCDRVRLLLVLDA